MTKSARNELAKYGIAIEFIDGGSIELTCACRKPIGWRLTENRAMLVCNESREKKLDPPGWDCSWLDEAGHTGQCFPMKGWHFEPHPTLGKIATRDLTPAQAARDTDIDTANAWNDLTNDERREILAGRATIYDYFDFRSKSTSR